MESTTFNEDINHILFKVFSTCVKKLFLFDSFQVVYLKCLSESCLITLPNSEFVSEPKLVISYVFSPAEFKNDIKNDILALV